MAADIEKIKQLREETLVSLGECKKALEESGGDIEKAKEILKKRGQKLADKKSARQTKAGIVDSYIHFNKKVGVLIELRCETDFVAKNEEFKKIAHDIAMQTAAMNPQYISPDEVPEDVIKKEKEIYQEQMANENKPAEVMEKIIQGKLNKFYEQVCLLNQQFIKDDKKTIKELIDETTAKLGEKIEIKKIVRFEI